MALASSGSLAIVLSNMPRPPAAVIAASTVPMKIKKWPTPSRMPAAG